MYRRQKLKRTASEANGNTEGEEVVEKGVNYFWTTFIGNLTLFFFFLERRNWEYIVRLYPGMADKYQSIEENEFYQTSPDRQNQKVNNVITRDPNSRISRNNVYEHRTIEHEKLIQKSLPSLKPSYGTIYNIPTFRSESDPLLVKPPFPVCQPYLCADSVLLPRYRRNQIFLFFYIVFYVGYLIIGSICFQRLETGVEQEVRDEFRLDRQKFLQEYPNVKGY